MTKEQLIKEYLQKSFEIGDNVDVNFKWKKTEKIKLKGKKELEVVHSDCSYLQKGKIVEIYDDYLVLTSRSFSQNFPSHLSKRDYDKYTFTANKDFCTLNTSHIGYSPVFAKEIRIQEYATDINHLLYKANGSKEDKEWGAPLNWNPVFETENCPIHYQRGFCWTLNQNQLLIESIYNQISIGKFIFRKRSWDYVQKYKDDPVRNGAFLDIVDGKQRLNAILAFINDDFADLNGLYFSEFSEIAKRTFLNFRNLSSVELDEKTTDQEVKQIFLMTNYSGVQMSQKHLKFVKSINLLNRIEK